MERADLETFLVKDLKKLLVEAKLPTIGRKSDLIDRLYPVS